MAILGLKDSFFEIVDWHPVIKKTGTRIENNFLMKDNIGIIFF